MSTIDVACSALSGVLPMLQQSCRILTSDIGGEGFVRLVIAGEAVPKGHVRAEISKFTDAEAVRFIIKFEAVEP